MGRCYVTPQPPSRHIGDIAKGQVQHIARTQGCLLKMSPGLNSPLPVALSIHQWGFIPTSNASYTFHRIIDPFSVVDNG